MERTRFAVLGLLAILGTAPSAVASNVAFFADPVYVDGTVDGEPAHMRAAMESLGHTVVPFTGIDGPSWAAALATADVFVLPENEAASLADSLSSAAREELVGFLLRGNGAVLNVDFFRRSNAMANLMFGWAVTGSGQDQASTLNAAAAAGTPFATGPATLPGTNAMFLTDTASLPPGALSLYQVGSTTALFAATVGTTGRIVFSGYDWFQDTNPPEWVQALGNAITYVDAAVPPRSLTVALFNDPTYVDMSAPGEGLNLGAALARLPHTIVPFSGISATEWRTALTNADVVVIAELESGNLYADMPVDARQVLARFVLDGGGLITNDSGSITVGGLNSLFGFSIIEGDPSGDLVLDPTAAAGTAFVAGPQILASSNATEGATTASLPANAVSPYHDVSVASLFTMGCGVGRIVHLGFDWFQLPTPTVWICALSCGLVEAADRTPPPALTATATAGQDVLTSVDLSGIGALSSAALRFRKGGDGTFQSVALTQASPTSWTATVPAAFSTAAGLQAFVELSVGPSSGTVPPRAPAGGTFLNVPVNLTGQVVASLPARSFRLNGLQVRPQDTNPVAVFDELGPYDVKKWRYGTFDGAFHEPGSGAANAGPGQGYWIISKNAATIAVNGTSADLSGPLNLTLRQGFNQIASPFNFPVDFADVVRPAEVEANLIGFDGSGYSAGLTTLQPGQGYWIRNNGPGTRVISIPPLGAGVAAAPRAPVNFAEGADWSIRVDAYAGPFNDRGNLFGTRAGALEGRDQFDLSEPPVAPEGWAGVALASADDGALFADWRPTAANGATWEVTFASDQSGEPFRIELVTERELPAGWDVAAFEGAREMDLGDARQISGVVGSTTAPRTFTVAAGDAAYLARARVEAHEQVTTFALAAPFPNPTSTGVTMDLALPAPVADALVNVYDVQGRLVKTLARGAMPQGVQRIAWDGRAGSGERASAGVYFVKARAGDFTASRKVVLLP